MSPDPIAPHDVADQHDHRGPRTIAGSLRRRAYRLLESTRSRDPLAFAIHGFIVTLIVFNVVAAVLETVQEIEREYDRLLWYFEVVSVAVFTVEYLLRVWSCTADPRYASPVRGRLRFMLTPMALVDLAAILPFYLPFVVAVDLRMMRALRLLRLFRIFKLSRYTSALRTLGAVLNSRREDLLVTAFVLGILLVFVSSIMYFVERDAQPEVFSSIPATMWWAVVTLTTVGYGDVYPVTPLGKLLGALISVLGVGMVALPAGMLASGFAEQLQHRRDRRHHHDRCPHCGKDLYEISAPDEDG